MKKILLTLILLLGFGILAIAQNVESNRLTANSLESRVELYPNPTIDFVTVEIVNPAFINYEFAVYSVIGTPMNISFEELDDRKYKFHVADLKEGYYLLVVKDKSGRFVKTTKFLKK
jgi:hypothetical protein